MRSGGAKGHVMAKYPIYLVLCIAIINLDFFEATLRAIFSFQLYVGNAMKRYNA